jgi:large subunit ribosomal protein L10
MEKQMGQHKISDVKIKLVKDLAKLIDSKKTLIIASTLNLSSSQLQTIRKKLRGKADVKFVKRNFAIKAIEQSKKEGIKEIVKFVTEGPALIMTDEDAYDIASILVENKYPLRAKGGQTARKDIVVEAGPTDLMPGPILTELGAAGLKAGIVGGKVTVKERSVLVKEGEIIPNAVASVLMKLEMLPFMVELVPVAAYNSNENKVYSNLKIDKEGALAKLKEAFATSLQLAIKLEYPTTETISQIIQNAEREAIAMNNITTSHTTEGQ